MTIPIELVVGIPIATAAAVTLWWTITKTFKEEMTEDLNAGEKKRNDYMQKTLADLQSRLKKLEENLTSSNGTLNEIPTAFSKDFDETTDIVDELEVIQRAKSRLILLHRQIRLRVTVLILSVAIATFLLLTINGISELSDIANLVNVSIVEMVFLIGATLMPPLRKRGRILSLLKSKKLDATA